MKEKMDNPVVFKPVLAKIEHFNCLGKSSWYEVVYFNEEWCSYAGSKTFNDGEKVVNWEYCHKLGLNNKTY